MRTGHALRMRRRVNGTNGLSLFYMLGEPKPELCHCSPVVLRCAGSSFLRKHQGIGGVFAVLFCSVVQRKHSPATGANAELTFLFQTPPQLAASFTFRP